MKYLNILLFLFILACNNKRDTSTRTLGLENRLSKINDTLYFSNNVPCINSSGNVVLISDYTASRNYLLDEDFKLINVLGRNGRGPMDFVGARLSCISENTIFITDDGNKRINTYDLDGRYKKQISFPTHAFLRTKFAYVSNNLFFSTPMLEKPFLKMNISNGTVYTFGYFKEGNNLKEKLSQNFYHILLHKKDSMLFCVSETSPIILIFDINGNQSMEYKIPKSIFIDSRLKFVEGEMKKSPQNRESTYTLFKDAILLDDRLFLLLVDNTNGKLNSNKVSMYKIDSKGLTYQQTLVLTSGYYESFCLIKEKYLIAYNNDSGSIDIFNYK
jgi:hypothetical protein